MKYAIKEVHISEIKNGDAVLHNNKIMTVCLNDIKLGFMGARIFGDSYRLGAVPVGLVIFAKATSQNTTAARIERAQAAIKT